MTRPPADGGPERAQHLARQPADGAHPLRCAGFAALIGAQFLGVVNDHLYRTVASLVMVGVGLDAGGTGFYLSLVGAVFILPYLLFSGYAGQVADVFDKRNVLVATKALEVAVMGLALLALLSGGVGPLLVVLFLIALQSTFFSPAKYGSLPEMLPESALSRGNGLLEASRYLAIISGTALGGIVLVAWGDRRAWIGALLIGIAFAGTAASLRIARVPRSGARKPFQANPWAEIVAGLRRLAGDRVLGPVVLAITCLELLAALVMLDMLLVSKEVLGLDDLRTGLLVASAGLGIAAGSLAAGRLSGGKVEVGLVPIGGLGVGSALILLAAADSFSRSAAALTLVGFCGGLALIPLYAQLQSRAGRQERGQLIATNNFLNMVGALLASGALWLLRDALQLSPNRIVLLAGLLALAATAALLLALPDYRVPAARWVATRHRIRRAVRARDPAASAKPDARQ